MYRVLNRILFFLSFALSVSHAYTVLIKLSIKPSLSFVCWYPVVSMKLPHIFFYTNDTHGEFVYCGFTYLGFTCKYVRIIIN